MFLRYAQYFLAASLVVATSSAQTAGSAVRSERSKVEVYESTADLKESLQKKPDLEFGQAQVNALAITVDQSKTYQQMDGFGASITDSSAWLIHNKLNSEERKDLMKRLFDPVNGIGLSFLRQPMGASDFALNDYSYDDLPAGQTDPEMKRFSIDHDRAYILPVLQQALAINPQLKIMATPWSPPGWMKSSGSLIQGTLLKSFYPALAKYFAKFIQAYTLAGVPIYAVTMQNEPLYVPTDYPGMRVSADEQLSFVRDHLAPGLRESGLNTKILIFDHNWDLIAFPQQVLVDPKAAAAVAGTATHCYGGDVSAQNKLHDQFPAKEIWETECSGGEWQKGNLLEHQAKLIIEVTRAWAKSVVLWNLALDQANGPHTGGCGTCRGLVTIRNDEAAQSSTMTSPTKLTVDYFALGHISKFVVPGAYRIESNSFEKDSLIDVAFKNLDGSIVLLALNSGDKAQKVEVDWDNEHFDYTLAAGTLVTFQWHGSPVPQGR
ncbi:MAG: glucosylceramidase [Acidobacteriaceae bacterium]